MIYNYITQTTVYTLETEMIYNYITQTTVCTLETEMIYNYITQTLATYQTEVYSSVVKFFNHFLSDIRNISGNLKIFNHYPANVENMVCS
jgi:hypothetical protein